MSMPKGANVPVPTHGTCGSNWAGVQRPGVPDVDASALLLVGGKVRPTPTSSSTTSRPHSSGAVRHEGKRDVGGRRHRHPARRPRARGARRGAASCSPPPRTAAPSARCPTCTSDHGTPPQGAESRASTAPDATVETAFVLGEFYRRQGAWKFRAVGPGLQQRTRRSGHGLRHHRGRAAAAPRPPPAPPLPHTARCTPAAAARGRRSPCRRPPSRRRPCPPPPSHQAPSRRRAAASPPPVRLTKVTLTKDAPSVSLAKQGGTSGALRVNLNWQVRKQFSKGWGSQTAAARVAVHGRPRPRPVRPLRTRRRPQGRRPGPRQRLRLAAAAAVHPPRRRRPHRRPCDAARTSPSTSTTRATSGAS